MARAGRPRGRPPFTQLPREIAGDGALADLVARTSASRSTRSRTCVRANRMAGPARCLTRSSGDGACSALTRSAPTPAPPRRPCARARAHRSGLGWTNWRRRSTRIRPLVVAQRRRRLEPALARPSVLPGADRRGSLSDTAPRVARRSPRRSAPHRAADQVRARGSVSIAPSRRSRRRRPVSEPAPPRRPPTGSRASPRPRPRAPGGERHEGIVALGPAERSRVNRRGFTERCAGELSEHMRHDGRPLGLSVLDRDNFKRVHDTRGHARRRRAPVRRGGRARRRPAPLRRARPPRRRRVRGPAPRGRPGELRAAAARLEQRLGSVAAATIGAAARQHDGLCAEDQEREADADLYRAKTRRAERLADRATPTRRARGRSPSAGPRRCPRRW